MYVELVNKIFKKKQWHALRFRCVAEHELESPLHTLPEILRMLIDLELKSYAIHFWVNCWGRFDFEILSESPEVKAGNAQINLRHKVGRLHHFFYDDRIQPIRVYEYADFLAQLKQYALLHRLDLKKCLSDNLLYSLPVKWHGLLDTYEFLSDDVNHLGDPYHHILKTSDKFWMTPPLNHQPCPFEGKIFLEDQVIYGFDHFLLALNYCPIGKSKFHVMLIPICHELDLSIASQDMMCELEALLSATLSLDENTPQAKGIYMQKHAQSGMTVPHLHIHVVSPTSEFAFRQDLLKQIRYFAATLDGREDEAHELRRYPLTGLEMKRMCWRYKKPLKQAFQRALRLQHLMHKHSMRKSKHS